MFIGLSCDDSGVAADIAILVVVNDGDLRSALCDGLTSVGLLAGEAEDGRDARVQLQTRPFEAIVTDLVMPEFDGLELLRWLHTHAPATRAIVLGGPTDGVYLRTARALGATVTLTTPVSVRDVVLAVQESVEVSPG